MALKKSYLRFQNRLYMSVIVFLGMLSAPMIHGCGNAQDAEKELQRIKDSIATAQRQSDSINKVKADSTAAAMREMEIQDSIRIADSIAKAKQQQQQQVKPKPNPYEPPMQTKYGVPANLRND